MKRKSIDEKENDRLGSGCWRIRQAVNHCDINTHIYHIRMTFWLQWIFSDSRFTHRNNVTKGGGIMTCSEDCSNSI